MAVRYDFLLGGLARACALACLLTGCTGDLVKGAPLDGGDDGVGDEPPTMIAADGGVVPRDARVSSPVDAARPPSGGDAGTPPLDPGNDVPPTPGKDASTPPAAQPDAGSTVPPTTRDTSTDKTKFTGISRCDSTVTFCDDFEQTVGGNPGSAYTYPFGFMPKIDSTHALRGTRSLYFATAAGTAAVIEVDRVFPAANNTIYGRMFVWIEGLPTGPNYAHWTVVGASGTGNNAEVRLDAQLDTSKGGNLYGIGSDGGDSGDWHTPGTESQSLAVGGAWTCLEWLFKGDTSETRVWIDAVEQTSLHTTSTSYRRGAEGGKTFIHPTFNKLRFGWWWYDAANAAPTTTKVWIDELAIDKARIGCVY